MGSLSVALCRNHEVETSEFFLLFQNRDCAYALPKEMLVPEDILAARMIVSEKLGHGAKLM